MQQLKGAPDKSGSTEATAPGARDTIREGEEHWQERYGSYIKQAYNWRLFALCQSVGLIVAIFGLIFLNAQSKFVPYVVAIDKIGTAIAVQPADRASPIDSRVVRAQLATWIIDVRGVTPDRYIEHRNLDFVYDLVGDDSAARGRLDEWYRDKNNDPYARAKDGTVEVNVLSILPITSMSYQLQWTETNHDLHGKVVGTPATWFANCMVAFRPPTDEATILKNPLGLYITSLDWQRKI